MSEKSSTSTPICTNAECKVCHGDTHIIGPNPEWLERPFDPWCPYCGADAWVSGCTEGDCRG